MSMTAYGILAGSCVLVLGISVLKQRAQIVLNFLVRMVLGVFGIVIVNHLLKTQGISMAVGLNPLTLLTTGTLGFGGVALLYAILLLQIL